MKYILFSYVNFIPIFHLFNIVMLFVKTQEVSKRNKKKYQFTI